MSDVKIDPADSPIIDSPVIPQTFDGNHKIKFRCHKEIACFNACCKNIDITLSPYDIIRLKQRLKLDSGEFLRRYTVPYELERDGMAAVKMLPVENDTACQFMTEEGCSVYEDRPTACRYYPVGLLSMRKQSEYIDRTSYAMVKEDHCLGHQEDQVMTIDEYRADQKTEDYDKNSLGWRQLILKRKSAGPGIGTLSLKSRQLFFMANYDLDRFRLFVISDGFANTFYVPDEQMQELKTDDLALLNFGDKFLRQVLFNEHSIALKETAEEARDQRKKDLKAAQKAAREAEKAEKAADNS